MKLRAPRPTLLAAAFLCAAAFATGAQAQAEAPEQLRMFLEKETSGVNGRVEVTIGGADSRLHLAACQNMQPFVPSGARLWGRTMLGVRCVEGATWQVFLPAQIKVFGQAPVASHGLSAGDAVTESDVRFEEVELTRFPAGAIADLAQVAEMQLSRPVQAGQPLLRDQFRARQVVTQGDTVKLVYTGTSFAVSTQARALSGATEGQTVRVVTETGKTLSGTALKGRVVEIKI